MSIFESFEKFPARRRAFRPDPLPEISLSEIAAETPVNNANEEESPFICVDDLMKMAAEADSQPDEADFICVDDLFRMMGEPSAEPEPAQPLPLTGNISFTLIPRKRYAFISGELSRVIRHSIAMSACEKDKKLISVRVRPIFVQWQLPITEADDPQKIMDFFRFRLNEEIRPYIEIESFWSEENLIRPGSEEMSINQMMRFINDYQEE